MKNGMILRVVFCGVLLGVLFVSQGLTSTVNAADINELLRQVNNELRQVERDMFGGKTEQAIAALEQIKAKLNLVKEADPENPQFKSHENRFKRLVRDLERRTGKDLGGGTLTAVGASTKTELPPRPEGKPMPEDDLQPAQPELTVQKKTEQEHQLPHAAIRPTQNAENDLQRIDSAIERMSDPKSNPNQLLGNMESYLKSARSNLEIAREEAARRGVTSHSRFDDIEVEITKAVTKIAEAREMHEASQARASKMAEEVTADVKALKDEYDFVQPVFASASGGAIYYNDLKPVQELIQAIEDFEKNHLKNLTQHLQAFGEKYGLTADEIDARADSMGYVNVYYRASYPFTQMNEGIENVRKTRTAMAEDLVRKASDMKELTSKGLHDFARMEQHKKIMEWGQMAVRFDPENSMVKEFNSGINAWMEADAKALNEKIDKAVFPRQAGDAPKDASELVKAAMEFLQRENEKLAAERGSEVSNVLSVSITGPWRIFSKNILGEPIQYNLPIATAVQTKSEKEQNLARVYFSTILTREMKGVEMGPPFTGVTMGDSYYIRPSAVNK